MAGLPNSRESLKQWTLKRLGKPVIEIEISDEQAEDRIDEAMRMFREFHMDGTLTVPVSHQITANNVTNKYIAIDDIDTSIDTITDIYPINVGQNSTNFFSFEYQFRLNDMQSLINLPVQDYFLVRQHLKLFEVLFTGKIPFRYNRNERRLYLDQDWGKRLETGDWIVVETITAVDPETYTRTFSDTWILDYTYALFKLQWGNNLKKYSDVKMMGGMTLNGQKIYDEAVDEVKALQDKLRTDYQVPLGFLVG